MQTFKNMATNLEKERSEWILTLPKALLSPGESWDSLFVELLDLGLFVEIIESLPRQDDWPIPGIEVLEGLLL